MVGGWVGGRGGVEVGGGESDEGEGTGIFGLGGGLGMLRS